MMVTGFKYNTPGIKSIIKSISLFRGNPGISSRNTSLNSYRVSMSSKLTWLFFSLSSIIWTTKTLQSLQT